MRLGTGSATARPLRAIKSVRLKNPTHSLDTPLSPLSLPLRHIVEKGKGREGEGKGREGKGNRGLHILLSPSGIRGLPWKPAADRSGSQEQQSAPRGHVSHRKHALAPSGPAGSPHRALVECGVPCGACPPRPAVWECLLPTHTPPGQTRPYMARFG